MNDATLAHTSALHCRNCDASLGVTGKVTGEVIGENKTINFCANCGQDTLNHPPTFWEFVHEFITHYVALEGKLWKTLLLLFFKPGELTREYRAGRKFRYIAPLRLYITASFIFFLVVKIAGFGNIVQTNVTQTTDQAAVGEVVPKKAPISIGRSGLSVTTQGNNPDAMPIPPEALGNALKTDLDCSEGQKWCTWLKTHLTQKWQGKTGRDVMDTLTKSALSNLPYAMFFMLPLFALLTKLAYWRRDIYFGEHMVYAFHVHAFAFFTFLAKALLPRVAGDIVFTLALLYYFIALQRYFGGRWWATTLRYGAIGLMYPTLLILMTTVIIFASVVI